MDLVLRKWGVILAEGVIAILASVLIVINIFNSWWVMVYFSLFIFIGAILILTSGTHWSLVFSGIAGILISLMLFLVLGLADWGTSLNELRLRYLSTYIAYWAIVSGLLQVITTLYLRMPLRKVWLYGTAGLLTLIFGISKAAVPASNLMFLAVYLYIIGVLLVIFALRLRVWLHSPKSEVEVDLPESEVIEEGGEQASILPEKQERLLPDQRMELKGWWAFLIRGLLAVLLAIGSSLVLWFQTDAAGIFLLFSLFAILSGIFAIIAVPNWFHKLSGVTGVIAGTFIFFMTVGILLSLDMVWPDDMTLQIMRYISVWAILTGLLEGVASLWLRRRIHGEWLMAVSGGVTVIFGVTLLTGSTLRMFPLIVYAFIYAALQIWLAFRLLSWLKRASIPQ